MHRILAELQAPLPQEEAWNAVRDPNDRKAFERSCEEFGIYPHSDWRVDGPNHGLDHVYFYVIHAGYTGLVYSVGNDNHFDPSRMSFTKMMTNSYLYVGFVKQDDQGAKEAWKTFLLDKSEGFVQPGVERLNDSIRTYFWAILGEQAQTHKDILVVGTTFDA